MDAEYVEKLRTIVHEDESGSIGSWEPWTVAAEREGGADLLHEMLQAGTVVGRRNPKLPEGSKIPYPLNMEIAVVKQVWGKKHKTSHTEQTMGQGDIAEFHTAFQAGPQMPGSSGMPGSSDQNPASGINPPETNKVDEVSKVAFQNIKKALWQTIQRNKKYNK